LFAPVGRRLRLGRGGPLIVLSAGGGGRRAWAGCARRRRGAIRWWGRRCRGGWSGSCAGGSWVARTPARRCTRAGDSRRGRGGGAGGVARARSRDVAQQSAAGRVSTVAHGPGVLGDRCEQPQLLGVGLGERGFADVAGVRDHGGELRADPGGGQLPATDLQGRVPSPRRQPLLKRTAAGLQIPSTCRTSAPRRETGWHRWRSTRTPSRTSSSRSTRPPATPSNTLTSLPVRVTW